jgi:hypothetical protein
MMGQSIALFDAMLSRDGIGSPFDPSYGFESVGPSYERSEDSRDYVDLMEREEQAEKMAETALDVMVSSLLNGNQNGEQTKEPQEIMHSLTEMGNEFLLSHRRLSESDSPAHAAVEQRLARRLTEYSLDLFYRPDGSVTLYSSSIPSFALLDNVPMLGMGNEDMDGCLYSSYQNGDLSQNCQRAVQYFLKGLNTPGMMYESSITKTVKQALEQEGNAIKRALDQGENTIVRALDQTFGKDCKLAFLILFVLYSVVAMVGLCMGLIDARTFAMGTVLSVAVVTFGLWSLFVLLPVMILMDRYFFEEEEESDEDVEEEGYDYVKLEEDDGEVKQAETLVFVGVPVQVV